MWFYIYITISELRVYLPMGMGAEIVTRGLVILNVAEDTESCKIVSGKDTELVVVTGLRMLELTETALLPKMPPVAIDAGPLLLLAMIEVI